MKNLLVILLLLVTLPALAQPEPQPTPQPLRSTTTETGTGYWIGSWAASQQIPEPGNALAPADLTDTTLRQIVHLSLGGSAVRVRLSNAFGTAPLHFTSVHIARALSPASAKIDAATDQAVTFGGQPDVTIPAGAEYVSDPVTFSAAPLSDLAVSFHLDQAPMQQTGHPGSRATSYLVHGDQVAAADLDMNRAGAKTVDHWYQLSGVEVSGAKRAACVVALGDSITDGHAAGTNLNQRWPDELARQLQAHKRTKNICVLNEGIGGNRLLHDGLGPNTMARFDRDVLAQPGVRYVILLQGINDIGTLARTEEVPAAAHAALVRQIELAYSQIVAHAHAHGIEVIGATITPFVGSDYYHPDAASEADRQAVNAWIRSPRDAAGRAAGHFDAVIDFDQLLRDPAQPDRLLPAYDSGDHLHPSPQGYKAMGDAIPLRLFGGK